VKVDRKISKYSRPLVASLLLGGGLMQLAAPALAAGTAAGTQITNTATASYEDPADPNNTSNTFSNTVKVDVAEVAGINLRFDTSVVVNATTLAPTNTGAVTGDKAYFNFTVINVGNDPTQFRIPGTAYVAGGNLDKVEYSLDGGTTWVLISGNGDFISPSKAPGDSIKVRVLATILAANGQTVDVSLGHTGSANGQNTDRLLDVSGGDVYTVDNTGTSGAASFGGVLYNEVAGAPSNGTREASASSSITVGAAPQAFATVTKVRETNNIGNIVNGVDNKGTAALTDDTLTYDLGLTVASQSPNSSQTAAPLAGTTIKVDGTNVTRVLVSDAVPQYTTAKTLTVPTGWTAVYTTDAAATIKANDASWTSVAGTGTVVVPATATRVGFIAAGPFAADGVAITGMKVTVELTTIPTTGGNVANIAQVFGSTSVGGTPDLTKPVYDESGDNKPNNYGDTGNPGSVDPITGKPVIDSGVVNPTTPGTVDSGNNNTGTGDGGEPNVFAIVPPGAIGILNGPSGHADATGPIGNNDDFTNVSAPIPATTWTLVNGSYVASPIDPGSVPFSNTLQTPAGTLAGSVNLVPTTPADPTSLPTGTKVTITQGSVSKTYVYNGTAFVDNAPGATTATPLVVLNVVGGTPVNYGVEIDLPTGTAQLKGYGVPITATTASGATNTTIDRIYTGYLKLTKEAQISAADGTIIQAYTDGIAPNALLPKAAPGQLIQYRITYTNISDVAPVGSNSVGLSAQNIRVTEDGNAGPNNWATYTTHKSGSAGDTNNGAISFDAGKSNTSPDVIAYTDLVAPIGTPPLAPQQFGSFSFTRVVK
jgi:hypothetical protein